MKIAAVLILLVATVASDQSLNLSSLKSVKINVPVIPNYNAHSEKIRKNENIAPVNYPIDKPGTTPQPESAGKVFVHPISRIVGGEIAHHGQLPWQVFIVMDNLYFCGGSLISNKWVLTAGQCVYRFQYFTILLGAQNIEKDEEYGRVTLKTYEAILHHSYDPYNFDNDIAVLKLPREVEFTPYINAVRLPTYSMANEYLVGKIAVASGWGKYSDAIGSISEELRFVAMPVIRNYNCANRYGNLITSSNICTATTGMHSICNGDTGGPLVLQESDGRYTEIGIVSYGSIDGCELGIPVVFTRVTSFLQWIETTTGIIIYR